MPRAPPLPLLLLLAATTARAAEVFVIADTANQTSAIAEVANETIAEANQAALAAVNDTLSDPDTEHDPIVRKKRTFGDIVFRGLADVLGYNVARKAPQVVFPPPLAPVPGIDAPLPAAAPQQRLDLPLQIPFAIVPFAAAPQADPVPCGRAVGPPPCAPPPPPPPPPKPKAVPPPCPKPRVAPKPKPKPKPKPQPPPCGSGRANPTTAAPCGHKPKADSNLETFSSNLQLDFNFNRKPAISAALTAEALTQEEQPSAQAQEFPQQDNQEQQDAPPAPVVAIIPQAAQLPPDPPRKPRVYLNAFVVQNGVPRKIQTVDAPNVIQHQVDNDFLQYDEPSEPQEQPQVHMQAQPADDDDYDYVSDSSERSKSLREFGSAVDMFWDQKKKKMKTTPAHDYRSVHFGDRNLATQYLQQDDSSGPSAPSGPSDEIQITVMQMEQTAEVPAQPQPEDEELEATTPAQNPRRRLKPRILPPTEKDLGQIDTITVRVPPIYKEKRPKKLHRERPERTEPPPPPPHEPEREEESLYKPYDYSFPRSDGNEFYGYNSYQSEPSSQYQHGPSSGQYHHGSDAESENSEPVHQTEQPKRKRRRKLKRKTRSVFSQQYTAGDFDYYGKKLPISDEEEYFRGLTIPPPTKDADVIRLEQAQEGDGHFLDDHERLRDDPERIKEKKKGNNSDDKEGADESEGLEESERAGESEKLEESEQSADTERSAEKERSGEKERADETERNDRLSPNARVRETGYKNNYVHAHNVQVDDNQPLVRTVKRKKPKKA